jgi:hypothetical protein
MSAADWAVLSLIASLALVAYLLRHPPKTRRDAAKASKAEEAEPAFKGDETQVGLHNLGNPGRSPRFLVFFRQFDRSGIFSLDDPNGEA